MTLWARAALVYDPAMRLSGWRRTQAAFARGLKEVLDVGCGTAFLASVVGPGYTGLDLEPRMLRRAPGTHRLVAGDARRLPFRAGTFDIVVSTGFLGLLAPALRAEVLSEMVRVCRVEIRVLEPVAGVTRAAALTLSHSPVRPAEFTAAGLTARIGKPVYFGLYAPVVARPDRSS